MGKHKHLILLVDDDKNFREILSLKLKNLGLDIIEAENGKEALEKLETINSDLVLLDLQMPVMDGVKTLMKIKTDSKFPKVKVVFLTNYGEAKEEFKDIDKLFAKDLGAMSYINKSEDLNTIVAEIEKIIHE